MNHVLILCVFAAIFTSMSCETKTLEYKGSNYTYAGNELGSFGEVEEWCNQMGGNLPSIHSAEDIYFLIHDLVGRHEENSFFPIGAKHIKRDINNKDVWEWSDKSRLDFFDADVFKCHRLFKSCGLVINTDTTAYSIKDMIIANMEYLLFYKMRMVCKLE